MATLRARPTVEEDYRGASGAGANSPSLATTALSDEEKVAILAGNAARLFGLDFYVVIARCGVTKIHQRSITQEVPPLRLAVDATDSQIQIVVPLSLRPIVIRGLY